VPEVVIQFYVTLKN